MRFFRTYDLRHENGVRWARIAFAPFDFLLDPGVWIKDTRVARCDPESDYDGFKFRLGPYLVTILPPGLRFDHGRPNWRLLRKFK